MAPEVIGHQAYDCKCDVHSFGMLMYEVTHLKVPFAEQGAVEAAFAVLNGARPALDLDQELLKFKPLLLDCWKAAPDARPSMGQVTERCAALYESASGIVMVPSRKRKSEESPAVSQQSKSPPQPLAVSQQPKSASLALSFTCSPTLAELPPTVQLGC